MKKTRKSFRETIFGEVGVPIQVINQFRDLGGHVCMDYSKSAVTLNQRMGRAIEQIQRLRWTKVLKQKKLAIIRTDILQAALYGSETAKASNEMMAKLRTAIVNVIGTANNHRAIELIFEANDEGKDVDPTVQTLVRKVALMRRIIDKFPDKEQTYVDNIKYHQKYDKKGINNIRESNTPNTNNSEMGPIGLLAEELAANNCCLNEHFEITQNNEQPISITRTPWQDLKRQVEGIIDRQRIKNATDRRTYLGKTDEFDNEVFNVVVKNKNDEGQISCNT